MCFTQFSGGNMKKMDNLTIYICIYIVAKSTYHIKNGATFECKR